MAPARGQRKGSNATKKPPKTNGVRKQAAGRNQRPNRRASEAKYGGSEASEELEVSDRSTGEISDIFDESDESDGPKESEAPKVPGTSQAQNRLKRKATGLENLGAKRLRQSTQTETVRKSLRPRNSKPKPKPIVSPKTPSPSRPTATTSPRGKKITHPSELKEPVLFNPIPEIQDTLLPWLAMGFSPVYTKGTAANNYCGIYAIVNSYTSAIKALQVPCNADVKDITFKAFQNLLKSKEYLNLAKAQINKIFPDFEHGDAEERYMYKEALAEQTKKSYLSVDQIARLLTVANSHYGTEFDLAFITQGYRGKKDADTEEWDMKFCMATTGNRMGNDAGDINRPVIFIWSDGGSDRWEAWGAGEGGGHWESFGAPTQKEDADRAEHRKKVAGWGLGQMITQDVDNGIWRVTQSVDPGANYLDVKPGHFVREVVPPDDLAVPAGCKYMRLCRTSEGNQTCGLVPEVNLTKIELHAKAPQVNPGQPGLEAGLEEAIQKFIDFTGQSRELAKELISQHSDVAKAVAAFHASISPKAPTPQKPKPKPPRATVQKKFVPGEVPFKIYRAISPTDKTGNPCEIADIDGFPLETGEFILGSSLGKFQTPFVTDIYGITGLAHIRRLQRIERPWDFPNDMVLPIFHDPNQKDLDEMTLKELQERIESIGGKVSQNKRTLLRDIREWEDANLTTLPLYSVARDYTAAAAQSTTGFLGDEVVRLTSLQSKNGKLQVCDFEGVIGRIAIGHLVQVNDAFGLTIRKQDANEQIRLDMSMVKSAASKKAPVARKKSTGPSRRS